MKPVSSLRVVLIGSGVYGLVSCGRFIFINTHVSCTIHLLSNKRPDIICGRGGLALKHPGNAAYRKIVGVNKEIYATCLKTEKLRISKSIVAAIREIHGRFLEGEDGKVSTTLNDKDANGNPVTWRDIGDKRAIEKTSQALREGQPKLLKKLAQRQESAGSAYNMPMNGQFNHLGGIPQTHMHITPPMSQQSQFVVDNSLKPLRQSAPTNMYYSQGGGDDMYGYQPQPRHAVQQQNPPPIQQNNFQPQQHRASFTASELAAVVEGVDGQGQISFNSLPPRDSFAEKAMGVTDPGRGNSRQSFHDSWGSEDPGPLPIPGRTSFGQAERNLSTRTDDSWGEEDPMPLAYHPSAMGSVEGHVFTTHDHEQLMAMLSVEQGSSSDGSSGVAKNIMDNNKRPSVKFQLQRDASLKSLGGFSLASNFSEMSIFSDALSLDSAMDAVQRDAEFDMLGEFEGGFDASNMSGMSIGTFESAGSGSGDHSAPQPRPMPRRSILRKSHKWSNTTSFPPAPINNHDPGLIFTSTMDSRPGGINSGTDISGLLSERRKSVVAFEVNVNRRRSSRMSTCSALTDISGLFKRDIGSVLSIQSADFRELMEDIGDDSSIEDDDKEQQVQNDDHGQI